VAHRRITAQPVTDSVSDQNIAPERLQAALEREASRVKELLGAAESARDGLAVLTLTGGSSADIEDAHRRLLGLAKVTEELTNWNSAV
jgi:hypothetical protein